MVDIDDSTTVEDDSNEPTVDNNDSGNEALPNTTSTTTESSTPLFKEGPDFSCSGYGAPIVPSSTNVNIADNQIGTLPRQFSKKMLIQMPTVVHVVHVVHVCREHTTEETGARIGYVTRFYT